MDSVMAFLAMPLSGNVNHQIAPWAMWHARAMVLAWGFLIPLGVLAARFFKVLPGQAWPQVLDNKAWWHTHRTLQWAGVGCMVIGLWQVWGRGGSNSALAQTHALAGWVVCALGAMQIVGALVRGSKGGPTDTAMRGDHYDMTPWRLMFERLHKGLGWLAVVMSIGVIVAGLVLADAPRWMLGALLAWWLVLVFVFVKLQRAGRCIDTYQAIWGPHPRHPGNQLRPIGWGIRRPQVWPEKGST